jgi:WD40 repeat protein
VTAPTSTQLPGTPNAFWSNVAAFGPALALATEALPDGRVVAVSGGGDGTVRRRDLATGQPIGEPLTGHTGRVWAVATGVLPDGRVVAVSGGGDGTTRFWDLVSGSQVVVVPVHRNGVTCVVLTAVGGFGSGWR